MPLAPPQPVDGPQASAKRTAGSRRRRGNRIAGLAAGQYGLVTLGQLEGFGLTGSGVRSRVEAGTLVWVREGVYSVGQPLQRREGEWLAAVLTCGPQALLSHRSAASLWGFLEDDRSAPIEITAPSRRGRHPVGIAAHRNGSLNPGEFTVWHGVPCTTPARTLLDLAAVLSVGELEKAISEAEVLRLIKPSSIRLLLRRHRGRRGVARLRLVCEQIHPQTRQTRSEMERLFLRMCSRAKLPPPEVNAPLELEGERIRPDFLWRTAGLVVEADSRRFHGTHAANRRDSRREQLLLLAGWRVTRCTWLEIEREPTRLATTVKRLLTAVDGP